MIIAADFISLNEFMKIEPASDIAVISIGDPGEIAPSCMVNHRQLLRLDFLDCERIDVTENGIQESALCSKDQITEAIEFIFSLHQAPSPIRLVIHCRMGVSRSASIALIAKEISGCHIPSLAEANFANLHVLEVAGEVLARNIKRPPMPDINQYVYLPAALAI